MSTRSFGTLARRSFHQLSLPLVPATAHARRFSLISLPMALSSPSSSAPPVPSSFPFVRYYYSERASPFSSKDKAILTRKKDVKEKIKKGASVEGSNFFHYCLTCYFSFKYVNN